MNIWPELEQGALATSPEAMHALARRLGEALPPEAVLALSGDLGVGAMLHRGDGVDEV